MSRCLRRIVPALALAMLFPVVAMAQPRVSNPRLRAALHELREARAHVAASRDAWPAGHREAATKAIDDAINSVRTILDVKSLDSFRGVDRTPDYYKRYSDHPRLRAALDDLRDARQELRAAKADFRGMKDRALDDIDVAVGHILTLIRYKR